MFSVCELCDSTEQPLEGVPAVFVSSRETDPYLGVIKIGARKPYIYC